MPSSSSSVKFNSDVDRIDKSVFGEQSCDTVILPDLNLKNNEVDVKGSNLEYISTDLILESNTNSEFYKFSVLLDDTLSRLLVSKKRNVFINDNYQAQKSNVQQGRFCIKSRDSRLDTVLDLVYNRYSMLNVPNNVFFVSSTKRRFNNRIWKVAEIIKPLISAAIHMFRASDPFGKINLDLLTALDDSLLNGILNALNLFYDTIVSARISCLPRQLLRTDKMKIAKRGLTSGSYWTLKESDSTVIVKAFKKTHAPQVKFPVGSRGRRFEYYSNKQQRGNTPNRGYGNRSRYNKSVGQSQSNVKDSKN